MSNMSLSSKSRYSPRPCYMCAHKGRDDSLSLSSQDYTMWPCLLLVLLVTLPFIGEQMGGQSVL